MKPVAFAWAPPLAMNNAIEMLQTADARPIAGGQSLGPMLNLRAVRPATLVPLIRLPELHGAEATPEAVTIGAATTHAAIADGRVPDVVDATGRKILASVAEGIAYRAVRNRGTIGGSLCHADPAADWLTTLTALRATVLTTRRAIALDRFVTGPYQTVLEPGEIVRAVRVPRPPAGARWGYHKLCRKPGEFAYAMVACLLADNGRIAVGATGGPPIILDQIDGLDAALAVLDPVDRQFQVVAARRALQTAGA